MIEVREELINNEINGDVRYLFGSLKDFIECYY